MNNNFLCYVKKPLIKEKNGVIIDITDNFLTLTEFSKNELCGKNINEILDKLFRSNHKINITNNEIQTVLFTKNLDVRFVKIKKYDHFADNINLYIFNEIENSRLDNKLFFVESLINDNKIGIAIYTAGDLKLIKANQKYLDYMPKPFNTKEAIYGKCISEFLKNYKKNNPDDMFVKVINNNKPIYQTESQIHILDDDNYWDSTTTPISENGEIKYIMSMLKNVTEQALSKKHIQVRNKKLKSIIEGIEDEISIVYKNGTYIKHSDMFKMLFKENIGKYVGYSAVLGEYYDLYENPILLDNLCFIKLLRGETIKGQKLKYTYNNKDYYMSINVMPIFNTNGKFEMGVIVTHNITELITDNRPIFSQNKELQIIFDHMSDGLAVVDKYGNYIKKNNALKKILKKAFNVSSLNKVGEMLINGHKYFNEDDKELKLEELPAFRVLKGETIKDQRIIIKKEHGKIYIDFNAVPILDKNGNLQYGIIFSHDITHIIKNSDRIKQEQLLIIKSEREKLEAAEKTIAMKDEFISLISHEFKTPLNVIFAAIQLIEYAYMNKIPDKVNILIKNIKQNTYRQLRLVNNLLDITRLNSGRVNLHVRNIDIVSLTKQISQSVKLYSNQKNIKLLFKCSLLYKNIATDDEKVERVILNLLSNAIKFTDNGGTVIVSLDEDKEANSIVLEVSDTGIGIPKNKQELIFERFGQVDSNLSRRAEGTGIGLSLVKKLVDVLNGSIELESEPGSGSTFRITLPINKQLTETTSGEFYNSDNRLVTSLNVEFSDIYL